MKNHPPPDSFYTARKFFAATRPTLQFARFDEHARMYRSVAFMHASNSETGGVESMKPSNEPDGEAVSGSSHIGAMELIGAIGYACFYACFLLMAFEISSIYPAERREALDWMIFPALFFGGVFLASICLRLVASHPLKMTLRPASILPTVAVAMAFPIFCSFTWEQPSPIAFGVFCVIAGSSCFYLSTVWNSIGGRIKTGGFVRFLGMSVCLGDILCLFTFYVVPPAQQCIVIAALLCGSGTLLLYLNQTCPSSNAVAKEAQQDTPSKSSSKRKAEKNTDGATAETQEHPLSGGRPSLDRRISVCFFAFNIAFGAAWTFLFAIDYSAMAYAFFGGVACIAFLLAALRQDLCIHDRYVTLLIRACMAITAICFLLAAFSSKGLAVVCLAALGAVWQAFSLVDTSLLMRHATKHQFSLMLHISTGRLPSDVGFFCGFLLGSAFAASFSLQNALAATAIIVIIFAVLAGALFFPFDNRKSPDALAQPASEATPVMTASENMQETCSRLASLYELSPRETEILLFLVKGRSTKFISETLVISEYTAKTHVYNIYKKTNVHSRNELLNLYEEMA